MELFNGGHIALSKILSLGLEEFRARIINRCHEDARLVNLFGSLESSGKLRVLAILGLDEEAGLEILSTLISPESRNMNL